jgi:hypothetical protein
VIAAQRTGTLMGCQRGPVSVGRAAFRVPASAWNRLSPVVLTGWGLTRSNSERGRDPDLAATDGDFNVGVTSRSELVDLIETERESGVFLSVLGFGRGNLNDAGLEELVDRGNGNYAYIDSLAEARRVLIDQAGATLVTIAKDVKIQVEFNPALVDSYRLIGYGNCRQADRDFAGQGSFEIVESLTRGALGRDDHGERKQFLQLIALAENLEDSMRAFAPPDRKHLGGRVILSPNATKRCWFVRRHVHPELPQSFRRHIGFVHCILHLDRHPGRRRL